MYLYPKWLRLWHLINAVSVIILIITGLKIRYSGDAALTASEASSGAVTWHNISAIILTIGYLTFVIGNILTENGKYYRIKGKDFMKNVMKQFRYYSHGMFRNEKPPFPVTGEQKFNPLQKLSYVLAMYVAMPLLIISGTGMISPESAFGGIFGAKSQVIITMIHIIMGFIISVFLLVHLYTCTLGSTPTSLFRSILSGYRESEEE